MPFTRRRLIARAARVSGAALAASALPPAAAVARPGSPTIEVAPWPPLELPDPPLRDAHYLAVADDVVRRLNRTWIEDERTYSSGGRVTDVIYNAAATTARRATTRGPA